MKKYKFACGGETLKAMTLYRYNIRLSQEMFVVIGYFEVALRNLILPEGAFYNNRKTEKAKQIIYGAYYRCHMIKYIEI